MTSHRVVIRILPNTILSLACCETFYTSITAVFNYISITTELITFQPDKTLVYPFVIIKGWFVKRYFPLNFSPFKHKLLSLGRYWKIFYLKFSIIWPDWSAVNSIIFIYAKFSATFAKTIWKNLVEKWDSSSSYYPTMTYLSSPQITKKKSLDSKVFEIHVLKIGGNSEFLLFPIDHL